MFLGVLHKHSVVSCKKKLLVSYKSEGKNTQALLNGKTISEGTKVPLVGGNELVFDPCGNHAYVSSSDP